MAKKKEIIYDYYIFTYLNILDLFKTGNTHL